MCVLQCLQSCRNGKRVVMIYSHLALHHRHHVWPPFPNLSLLPISPPPAWLSPFIFPPSFFTPHLLSPPSSQLHSGSDVIFPPCHPLTLLYHTEKMPHFQLLSPTRGGGACTSKQPWLFNYRHHRSSPPCFASWGPRILQKSWEEGSHGR